MATISTSSEHMKRCSRCNFKTTDEDDMHAHVLEQRAKCGAQFYTDDALRKAS